MLDFGTATCSQRLGTELYRRDQPASGARFPPMSSTTITELLLHRHELPVAGGEYEMSTSTVQSLVS